MKRIKIGLLGTVINNSNLGCVALTYSLVKLLEDIAHEQNWTFDYSVFENKTDAYKSEEIAKKLSVPPERIKCFRVSSLYTLKSTIGHCIDAIAAYRALVRCDIVIDLTEGDSFTDIYGQKRFNAVSKIKQLVEKRRIPLILGPQTYGPYMDEKNKERAKIILEKAYAVVSRDLTSAEFIKEFSTKDVYVGTDLAFLLPYKKSEKYIDGRTRIGVNISSLLVKNKTESTEKNFSLKTDYDEYIFKLLNYLRSNTNYDVYIIPHVGKDGGENFIEQFPEFTYISSFSDPIEAKNMIATLDIFIGARMHATIAAISSEVATIPIGYSRKFKGLYERLGYNYTIDLLNLETQEAFDRTVELINSEMTLKEDVLKAKKVADKMLTEMKGYLATCLSQLIEDKK